MRVESNELINEHARVGAARFPGSAEVQTMPWNLAGQIAWGPAMGRGEDPEPFDGFFYTVVYFTDFDCEWPVATDWKAVIKGLRGSLHLTQADFADQLQFGRATVERWEIGKTAPLRGNALELLDRIRPHINAPLQAGQMLNVAAAAVLPHLTRPTAEYTGNDVANLLKDNIYDHSDLAKPLINALNAARIFIELDSGSDELDTTYITIAARPRPRGDAPEWGGDHLRALEKLTVADRDLVLQLAQRLAMHT